MVVIMGLRKVLVVMLVATLLMATAGTAFARGDWGGGGRHGGGHRGGGGGNFLWGLLAGAAVVGVVEGITRPYYSYPPQYYPQQPVYYYPVAPAPVCGWVSGQPMFDAYGSYMGTTPPVRVCQ